MTLAFGIGTKLVSVYSVLKMLFADADTSSLLNVALILASSTL